MSTSIFGQQILANFDKSSAVSCISLALVTSLNCHGSRVSLPVNADMGQGSFTCVMNLTIADELSAGIILRKDWFAYYREYLMFEGRLSQNCCNDGGGWSDTVSGVFTSFSIFNFHFGDFLTFITGIESLPFENIDYYVHHDIKNPDLQLSESAASSTSSCKVPLIQKFLLNHSSSLHMFHSSEFRHLLQDHGIPIHETDLSLSQMALLHHFVNGLCIHNSNMGCHSVVDSSDVENLT